MHSRPYALRRHRHTRSGRTYDPDKQRKEEFRNAVENMPNRPLMKPLRVSCVFTFKRPKSKAKYPYPRRCDIDNLCKFYLDALNGWVYGDDAQVVHIDAQKQYGEEHKVELHFAEIDLV